MARVVALVPDLLFGSRVQALLSAAGHDVTLSSSVDDARSRAPGADVLVADLTTDAVDPVALLDGLSGVRTLAFYSHVDAAARRAAEAAGFDRVVPRSRMNREGAELVSSLARSRSA